MEVSVATNRIYRPHRY